MVLKNLIKMKEIGLIPKITHTNLTKLNRINAYIDYYSKKTKQKEKRGIHKIKESLNYWKVRKEFILNINYKANWKNIREMKNE